MQDAINNLFLCTSVKESIVYIIKLFFLHFRFETSMKSYTPASSVVGFSSTLSSSVLPLSPPNSISEHALLARLTNTLLTAFNELRQCAPIGISPSIVSCVRECLMSVVQCVSHYHRYEYWMMDC